MRGKVNKIAIKQKDHIKKKEIGHQFHNLKEHPRSRQRMIQLNRTIRNMKRRSLLNGKLMILKSSLWFVLRWKKNLQINMDKHIQYFAKIKMWKRKNARFKLTNWPLSLKMRYFFLYCLLSAWCVSGELKARPCSSQPRPLWLLRPLNIFFKLIKFWNFVFKMKLVYYKVW